MNTHLHITPLHPWHKKANANMAEFGGYDMPLWYETGVKTEHLAVLRSAGLFDTSHMACIRVKGEDAVSLLNYCFTRDISHLPSGRCVYGAFLNEKGHCIDDAIVYKFTDNTFLVCVNAGMGGTVAGHLNHWKQNRKADVLDLTGQVAKIDIQGKNSARILSGVIRDPESVFRAMPYFSFKGQFDPNAAGTRAVRLTSGTPVLLSRSGYTGEFGFEIFLSPDAVVDLWETLLSAGKDAGILPCGLGARDSLRAGAGLPLSHQDIGPYKFIRHPWEFALPYNDDQSGFTKDFLGAAALTPEPGDHYIYPFAGDTLRKVSAGPSTHVLDEQEDEIGHVLTCATDMGITWHNGKIVSIADPQLPEDVKIKGLGCGFIRVTRPLSPGTRVMLAEGRRIIQAAIVTDIRPLRTARQKISRFF